MLFPNVNVWWLDPICWYWTLRRLNSTISSSNFLRLSSIFFFSSVWSFFSLSNLACNWKFTMLIHTKTSMFTHDMMVKALDAMTFLLNETIKCFSKVKIKNWKLFIILASMKFLTCCSSIFIQENLETKNQNQPFCSAYEVPVNQVNF